MPTLVLGQVTGQTVLDVGLEVVPQHVDLDAVEHRNRGIDLVGYVAAVPPLLDHPLQAPDLALAPAQTGDLPTVIDRAIPPWRFSFPGWCLGPSVYRQRT
jgi:hypothetical protein